MQVKQKQTNSIYATGKQMGKSVTLKQRVYKEFRAGERRNQFSNEN